MSYPNIQFFNPVLNDIQDCLSQIDNSFYELGDLSQEKKVTAIADMVLLKMVIANKVPPLLKEKVENDLDYRDDDFYKQIENVVRNGKFLNPKDKRVADDDEFQEERPLSKHELELFRSMEERTDLLTNPFEMKKEPRSILKDYKEKDVKIAELSPKTPVFLNDFWYLNEWKNYEKVPRNYVDHEYLNELVDFFNNHRIGEYSDLKRLNCVGDYRAILLFTQWSCFKLRTLREKLNKEGLSRSESMEFFKMGNWTIKRIKYLENKIRSQIVLNELEQKELKILRKNRKIVPTPQVTPSKGGVRADFLTKERYEANEPDDEIDAALYSAQMNASANSDSSGSSGSSGSTPLEPLELLEPLEPLELNFSLYPHALSLLLGWGG